MMQVFPVCRWSLDGMGGKSTRASASIPLRVDLALCTVQFITGNAKYTFEESVEYRK